ncbi:hypothetical protein [Anaerobaca lacustris]|uniref:DUF1571 domain-containing protein n=1 Tax=Anaerobaca lacustris TaxID=3044600 RepID=A0AAW6TX03_9BACT|nr:hypothetical protein [Sedimentisphaerales bacterium M17dextr]
MRIMAVMCLCCVCSMDSDVEHDPETDALDIGKETGVTIELTKLEMTDSFLDVVYKISNSSDHDIWVCSEISSVPFEVFLACDMQTLLIRKRLDIPSDVVWRTPPAAGTYICLSPGGEQIESLRTSLPVTPRFFYAAADTRVEKTVGRVAVEVGFYDHDLPALIRSIFEVADKFDLDARYLHPDIQKLYFRGLSVRRALVEFDLLNIDPYGEGRVRIDYSYQALTGEKVLRMEITGVAIPYAGRIEKRVAPNFPLIVE